MPHTQSMTCTACRTAGTTTTRVSAKLSYVLLFVVGQVSAWIMRSAARDLITALPFYGPTWKRMRGLGVVGDVSEPPDSWFGYQGVLRASLGNFLFFALLALGLLGVQRADDPRHVCVPLTSLLSATAACPPPVDCPPSAC